MNQSKPDTPAIHPTAVVHSKARLGRGVSVGPYTVIGPEVQIGDGTVVMNHVTLEGPAVLGRRNRIFPYASIGLDPQDKKYRPGEPSLLEIGDDNSIREFVTLNRGTEMGGAVTRIGHRNWIMAYVHVAHDCLVGNDTILANCTTLGGHVTIQDFANLGGFTAVHQYCQVGELAMTGAHTMLAQDVPPYAMAVGNRAKLFGINRIGLERAGLPPEEIRAVQDAYRLYFRSKLGHDEGLAAIEAELAHSERAMRFAAFIRKSTRGVCR
jgi:UDP-N-acetylglucosamine acyltransferase